MSTSQKKFFTILVTRNKSCHVRTMHTILIMNQLCALRNIIQDISFVKDDRCVITDTITKKMKDSSGDRIIFFDYGVSIANHDTIAKMLDKFDAGGHCMVLPCVTEGIDWERFKDTIESDEPLHQKGLHFDTEVSLTEVGDIRPVTRTNPVCWCWDIKPVNKLMKVKGEGLRLPPKNSDLFEKLISKKVKVTALTTAELMTVYPHECLGNILNSSGVIQKM